MDKILIKSSEYVKGHANNSMHSFGQGLIVDGGKKGSCLIWEFEIFKPGVYYLLSSYASNDFRNVELAVDDTYYFKSALGNITGGWTISEVKKFIEAEINLDAGNHQLTIKTQKLIPHLRDFQLILKTTTNNPLQKNLKELLLETFSINPYKEKKPSLFKKTINSFVHNGLKKTCKKIFLFLSPFDYFSRCYADILGFYTHKFAFRGPSLVQIDVTNSCNNNCIGCWCNSPLLGDRKMQPKEQKQMIPKEKCFSLLKELNLLGCKEIYFSGGGEPFTHPDIMDILRKAKEYGFIVYINTNFTLLEKEKLKEIDDIGIDHLTVSVWAGSAKTYVKTHPNKSEEDFYDLKEKLLFLNKTKSTTPFTKVYHVISSMNYFEIDKMMDFAIETESDSVEYTMVDIVKGRTESLLLNEHQLKELQKKIDFLSNKKTEITIFEFAKFLSRISDQQNTLKGEYDKIQVSKIPCAIGWTFARINADGNVNGCLKSHKYSVGNIFSENFQNIWNGKKMQHFRKTTLSMNINDPLIQNMGNNKTSGAGCINSCDDIGRNQHFYQKLKKTSSITKFFLKMLALPYKYNLKSYSIKPLARNYQSVPKDVQGFLQGNTAYCFPAHIAIDLTNRCNNRCLCCFTYSSLFPAGTIDPKWHQFELSKDILFKLLQELAENGVRRIRFSGGGDPLLHKNLIEAVSFCKDKGIYTAVTTSLFRIKQNLLSDLISSGLNEISVSLLAGSASVYQLTHHNAEHNDFSDIINNIKQLVQSKKIKVNLSYVLFNKNYEDLFNMVLLSKDLGVSNISLVMIDPVREALKTLCLNKQQNTILLKNCNKAILHARKYELPYLQTLEKFKKAVGQAVSDNFDVPCSVGWHYSRILANGDVIPCCKASDIPLGNINENSFSAIWHGKRYDDFRCFSKQMQTKQNYYKFCFPCDNVDHNSDFYTEKVVHFK